MEHSYRPSYQRVPRSLNNAGKDGLLRRVNEHKDILSLDLEAILHIYNAHHGLVGVPPEGLSAIPAVRNRRVLYCHVKSSQDKQFFVLDEHASSCDAHDGDRALDIDHQSTKFQSL